LEQEQIRQSLEELREELGRLEIADEAERGRLAALVADIEHGLDNPDDSEHHASVIADLEDAISRFEVEHPRATGLLNHIMVTLGSMGI